MTLRRFLVAEAREPMDRALQPCPLVAETQESGNWHRLPL